MKRRPSHRLLALLQSYFVEYLRGARGVSEHTIRAYRDSLRLLLVFTAHACRRQVASITLDDINAAMVAAFLNDLERSRKNCVASRNCRLAAIKGFVSHLLRHDIERAAQYERILALPVKKVTRRRVDYLEPMEARRILEQASAKTASGMRDFALLLLLYNTGARISEALDIRPRDLHLYRPRHVRLRGKGGKERICPLWSETAVALGKVIQSSGGDDEILFRNARGVPLTRDGAAYLLRKYVRNACVTTPSLRRRSITPHTLRHSCAVALLQAGVDLTVIRDYLGHVSVATTGHYVTANMKMKHQALSAFWKKSGLERGSINRRWRPTPNMLAFLESL